MNPVIEALLTIQPKPIQALTLLHTLDLHGLPDDPDDILKHTPEIEIALEEITKIQYESHYTHERCSKLQPTPFNRITPGF